MTSSWLKFQIFKVRKMRDGCLLRKDFRQTVRVDGTQVICGCSSVIWAYLPKINKSYFIIFLLGYKPNLQFCKKRQTHLSLPFCLTLSCIVLDCLGLSAVHNSSLHYKLLTQFSIPPNYSQGRAGLATLTRRTCRNPLTNQRFYFCCDVFVINFNRWSHCCC